MAGLASGQGPIGAAVLTSLAMLLVQAVPYGLLAALVVFSARWEIHVIRTCLADEVGTPSVTLEEYQAILRETPFRSRTVPGPRGPQILNAQDELAFRKWHVLREGGDPSEDPAVQAWCEDLRLLREG